MSSYLDLTADAAAYDLAGLTAKQVTQASDIIDAYLRRPEGLVWQADYAGAPGWMAGLSPRAALTLTADIAPGKNVAAPVSGLFSAQLGIGEAVVLDRAGSQPEVCTVVSSAPGVVTLDSVANSHTNGAKIETGLLIFEERPMPNKRSMTRASRPNFVRLRSAQGRFGYGRRSDQMSGTYNEVNLLATLATFGGPPQWISIDTTQVDIDYSSGEMWVPASMMLAYYTDIRLYYVAGFAFANLPHAIKQACALVCQDIANLSGSGISGGMSSIRAGDTEIRRGGAAFQDTVHVTRAGAGVTMLSSDAKALLDPYRVRAFS